MNDRLFRVVVTDPELLATAKEMFGEFVYDSDALLGLQMTEGGGGLWSLVSGSGEVLARSRDKHDVFGSLLNFIDELAAPPPPEGVARLSMRAVVRADDEGATLFGPYAHVFGPLVERRLEKAGLAVVDSRFVDVEIGDAGAHVVSAGADGPIGSAGAAHVSRHAGRWLVERVVLPEAVWQQVVPPPAMVAADLATATRSGTLRDRLLAAVALASIPAVTIADATALY